jgi:pimeloyl-ACP methyl ester carboxylesterase
MLSGGYPLLVGLALSVTKPDELGDVKSGSFYFAYIGVDGAERKLLVRHLQPVDATRPPVCLLHFTSGHSGNMLPAARELCASGYPTYVPDLPHHGMSSPTNRFFEDALSALCGLCRHIRERHAGRKIGLVGSSLGGDLAVLVVLSEAHRQRTLGIEPSVGSAVGQGIITLWQRDVARHFSLGARIINATEPIPVQWLMPLGIHTSFLFRPRQLYESPHLRRQFRDDPLRRRSFPAALVILGNRFRLSHVESGVETPTLILVGTQDRIVRLRYEHRVYRGLSRFLNNIEMQILEGASHGMFEEHVCEAVHAVDRWFRTTLSK